ncbi:hypothetical protein CQW23_24016 [Capsicum baccatum]|uniref:GATA-type domain-containing protein n=1 Tax=Capsicum baccatum TaxID=33114 RepID=A0A2G2VTM4_CAPBA|nr:hypothetical protein CQW23_24016 [Capsicum baccatum]
MQQLRYYLLFAKKCRHCGFSSKSNPMIRHGPAGPRSLCNACGLMWANKFIIGFEALLTLLFPFGILRDLSKVSTIGAQEHCAKSSSEQVINGSDAMAATGIITSNDENIVLPSEQ